MAKGITELTASIIDVCKLREAGKGRSCKDCIYYGKKCEKVKARFSVTSPSLLEYQYTGEHIVGYVDRKGDI